MLKTTLKLNEQINELMNDMSKVIGMDGIKTMNPDEFELIKKSLILLDTSQELMVRQAELIEGIYKKLDALEQKKKES